MRKIKLYIAMSLNGKIADKAGSVDWLETIPKPENDDYGYADFYKSVDTTIQGAATYRQIMDWGIPFPYADKKNYVLTRNQKAQNTEDVEFITTNHLERIQQLKQLEGGDIWLIGGGQLNTLLLNASLIDEIDVFVMPIVLKEGIDVFENFPDQKQLSIIDSKTYSTGVVEIKYKVEV